MDGREIIEALHSGRRVYGTCIKGTSPLWPQAVAALAFGGTLKTHEYRRKTRQHRSR